MSDDRVKYLKAYSKVWKIERWLYAIGGWNLPVPVAINMVGYTVAFFMVMLILSKILPILEVISPIWRLGVIPAALAIFCNRYTLDGKNPLAFVRSVIVHWFIVLVKGPIVSRFRCMRFEGKAIYKGVTSFRKLLYLTEKSL